MSYQRTEVIGTVRSPDGVPSAEIDGLVIYTPDRGMQIVWKQDAILRARMGLLWCQAPNGGNPVEIEAVDRDRDGQLDYVQTKPDHTKANNLLRLNIWDRQRQIWLDWQGRQLAA